MKKNIAIIVFLLLLVGVAASAQDVIYIPAIWSPDGQVQSAAVDIDFMLNDGDHVACVNGGVISFEGATDGLSSTVLCAAVATETPLPTDTATPAPTDTLTPIDTDTSTPIPTDTSTAVPADTSTATPIDTSTATATSTAVPATNTNTPVLSTSTATSTPVPPTNTATNTPVPATATNTNTPVPPTLTFTPIPPTATFTPAPPTFTPTPGATVTPFAAAPLCPTHNDTAWHSLWDSVRGCHYNHTHNADPAEGNALFGPAGALWGGSTISYPWQTGDGMEQAMKHNGYKYLVERNLPQQFLELNWSVTGNNGITDIRLEHHRMGGPMDFTVRLHSFYQEVRICKPGANRCGIMKFGGWNDYGILHSPYKQTRLPLALDPPGSQNQDINVDPYRSILPQADAKYIASLSYARCKTCGITAGINNDVWSLWSTHPGRYGFNKLGGTATIVFDDWQGVIASNPAGVDLLCDPVSSPCRFNNSEHQLFTAWAYVPPSLDTNNDGWVTYTGYTNRNGDIVQGCTLPTMDCVPLVMADVPVGYAGWLTPSNNGKMMDRWRDYDLSPGNVYWVMFPN